MNFRTDLALEAAEIHKDMEGLEINEEKKGKCFITKMCIKTKHASEKIGKPIGNYITVSMPKMTENFKFTDDRIKIISQEIKNLIPKDGLILVVGLGNTEISPDALGPKSVGNVLATRHISDEIKKSLGLLSLRPVSVLIPGVLGKTGIEVLEILSSMVNKLNPSCLIIIDALASRHLSRLGCTVQISDSGISPGAGVGNHRPCLNEKTLGIPVISMGVPTVVDASTLINNIFEDLSKNNNIFKKDLTHFNLEDDKNMIVTPKEIDLLISRASFLIGMSINCALHPDFSAEEIYTLVS